MAGKNTAVYAMYRDRLHAEEALDRLLAGGFRKEDVAALLADNRGTKDFAHEKNTKAPEGTTAGVITGGAIGGTLGLLAGIGMLAIPGLGPFIAAGPIMATLAGLGAGGAVGGLIGALVGMGIPEYEAKRYEGRIKEGGVLLSVHCDNSDWVKRAKELLKLTGGEDIASAGESAADYDKSDKPLPRRTTGATFGGATLGTDGGAQRRTATSSTPVAVHEYDFEDDFRRDFEVRYQHMNVTYEEYAPAYRFGATAGERYRSGDWSVVEPQVHHDWERAGYGNWDKLKDAVRYGWIKVSGRV